jgi:polysaccharide biosynthesis protein PslH
VNVLFATPTPPVLTKPRPHHFIRGLAARGHTVHLLCQIPSEAAAAAVGSSPGWAAIEAACASVTWVVLTKRRSVSQALIAVPTRTPLRVAYCRHPDLRARASELIRAEAIDVLHVDRERLAPFFAGLAVPKVLDVTDSITLFLRRSLRRGPVGERLVSAAEIVKMPAFERRMGTAYDACLVTGEVDARALREVGAAGSLEVLGNGVEERLLEAERRPEEDLLVFTGNLSYGPNVDAARWFTRRVLPIVREDRPSARVALVGHHPARSVRRLDRRPGVEVTGTVPDTLPYLQRASAFVVPMRIGGGFSNKLAEALGAATPTVAAPPAREGLPGLVPGTHLLEAEGEEAFADAAVRLLSDPGLGARLGAAGRRFVRQHHTWDGVVARLERILRRVRDARYTREA